MGLRAWGVSQTQKAKNGGRELRLKKKQKRRSARNETVSSKSRKRFQVGCDRFVSLRNEVTAGKDKFCNSLFFIVPAFTHNSQEPLQSDGGGGCTKTTLGGKKGDKNRPAGRIRTKERERVKFIKKPGGR